MLQSPDKTQEPPYCYLDIPPTRKLKVSTRQPTTAKLNAADGSLMSAIGAIALHQRITEFKFTHSFNNLQPIARNRTHFWH